ncbi:MAG: exodeoxyribonuclease VII small subunit [Crocinitomicaceae bacterium]|nr:exodeoxyribonuclease VII small subunit [Crocinitomicaceae bacterium]|tara:strand:+ start:1464 stop:1682 length:219 start_codon:yes stop_codon:yes gene_type:complete
MTKNNSADELSYDDAIKELKNILSSLQDETLSIDQLTDYIKRASELLESCNSRLTSTEKEVNSVIKKLGLGD